MAVIPLHSSNPKPPNNRQSGSARSAPSPPSICQLGVRPTTRPATTHRRSVRGSRWRTIRSYDAAARRDYAGCCACWFTGCCGHGSTGSVGRIAFVDAGGVHPPLAGDAARPLSFFDRETTRNPKLTGGEVIVRRFEVIGRKLMWHGGPAVGAAKTTTAPKVSIGVRTTLMKRS